MSAEESIFQIAIDGPVGAGKSTVAKRIAVRLGILYIDTGAMYRAVALYARERQVDWHDEKKISGLVDKVEIKLERPEGEKIDGRNATVMLNGKDVSWEIREADYGEGASVVGQYVKVRKRLVALQREMAKERSVIMEGRDIGTRVLPSAKLKVYMDASVDERVKRKKEQLDKMGSKISLSEARDDVETRDSREMNREVDPLRPADDAWILDTTDLSVIQVVDKIAGRVA